MNIFRVELAGAAFSIKTDEDPSYLRSLQEAVRQKLSELEVSTGTKDGLKLAVLACLMYADEKRRSSVTKGELGQDREAEELSALTTRLIRSLDDSLKSSQ